MNELLERRCVQVEIDSEQQEDGKPKKKLSHEETRQLLEAQTAEFLASGRKIYHAPPSQYDHTPRLGSAINIDREVERADRMARLPEYLRAPKNESGCRGVIRDSLEWIARWENKRIDKRQTVDEAITALLSHLERIGYKPD